MNRTEESAREREEDLASYEYDPDRERDAEDPYWRERDSEVGPY